MAFIFRYYIKNKQIRGKVNLTEHSADIIKTIKQFYQSNLKDCRVVKDYYEYKLHLNVDNQRLREFGKILLQNCVGLKTIWQSKEKKVSTFFVRKMHEYYAFLNREEDSAIISIDLIDVIDISDYERLTSQALENISKYLERYNIKSNPDNNQSNTNEVARAYYIDVFTLDINSSDLKDISSYLKPDSNIKTVIIKGFHRRKLDKIKIIAELDVDQLRNSEISDAGNNITPDNNALADGFEVTGSKKLDAEEVARIMKSLNIYISAAKTIKKRYEGNSSDINFIVHNVGQALSTSLSVLNNPPFLYFDFGISEGPNEFNRPTHMTVDVSQVPSIILSHIHRDHWYGITVFTKSFECNWYIPDQYMEPLFRKRCAEIIVSGGSVSYINTPISLGFGTIIMNINSRYNPTRLPSHKHDNGLAIKMTLQSKEMKNVNILIAGDQRYDYMPEKYLKEIDILVASHHGGEYSWSKRRTVYDDIPISTGLSQIIYSYGYNNTHNHPSEENQYNLRGWKNSHKTAIHSDYKLK